MTIPERMAHYEIPGLSLAVINNGKVEWAQGYGQPDSTETALVNTNTLFQAGSISKTATALAALRMVDAGLLSLDEDVNTFLQSWRVPTNGPWQPRITLRQLLSHTAGTTVHGFGGYPQGDEIPTLLQILNGEKPANTPSIYVNLIPGTQFRYSGGGTTIVQQLLIDVAGKPFPDLMREWLLNSLDMDHSTFQQPLPASLTHNAASGHYWVHAQPTAGKWHTYPEMAAAGLWTTASDLAQLLIAIQRSIAGDPGAFLTKETAAQMLTTQAGSTAGLGLTDIETTTNGSTHFGHRGDTQGFNAELTAYTTPQIGLAILTNSYIGSPLIAEILAAVAREYDWPNPPPSRQSASIEPGQLDTHTGTYEYAPGVNWKVERAGDNLFLHPAQQSPLQLCARSSTEFFARAVNTQITFTPTEILLNQDGQEKSLKRL